MTGDVIYPGGVRISGEEHARLQLLGLHNEPGVIKDAPWAKTPEQLVEDVIDADLAEAEANRRDAANLSALAAAADARADEAEARAAARRTKAPKAPKAPRKKKA